MEIEAVRVAARDPAEERVAVLAGAEAGGGGEGGGGRRGGRGDIKGKGVRGEEERGWRDVNVVSPCSY